LRNDIRLTAEEIVVKQENALDLYYSGIKSEEMKKQVLQDFNNNHGKLPNCNNLA